MSKLMSDRAGRALETRSSLLRGRGRIGLLAGVSAAVLAAATPASADLVTSIAGGTTLQPTDRGSDPTNSFFSTIGSVQIGTPQGRDIVWTSNLNIAVAGYSGHWEMHANGYWIGAPAYFGLNSRSASDTMTFLFNDGSVSSVGGYLNHIAAYGPFTIEALDRQGAVLETYALSIASGDVANGGQFYGIQRSTADIAGFRLGGSYGVLRNFTYAGFAELVTCPSLSASVDICAIDASTEIVGTADALGGSDIIQLGGATDFTFDADTIGVNFLNFEQVRKTGTSTATLTGSSELQVFVDQGALVIAADGSVTRTSGDAVTAAGGATLTNQGQITASAGSGVVAAGDVAVTNSGTISGALDGVRISGAGTVTNQAGGVISGAENGVQIDGAGTVTNAGTIRTDGPSGNWPAVYIGGGGTVTNLAGGLIDGGSASNAVYITGGAGVVDNAGTIVSEQSAVYFSGDGTVTNRAGGLIDSPFNAVNIQGVGTVTNAGTIRDSSATGGNYPVVFLGGGGTVTNEVGGLIEGTHGTAIYVRSGNGQLDNLGAINGGTAGPAVRFDGGGRVTNAGTITAAGTEAVHIRGGLGEVVNFGTLTGNTGPGVFLANGGSVDNRQGGAITSAGGTGVTIAGPATLTNAGTISSAVSYGVWLSAGGTLTNQSGGVISGALGGGVLLSGSGDYTVDLQQGSITAGIDSTDDGSRTVTIAGVLESAYNAGAGTGVDVLTLAATGAMTSAALGGGDDVFNYQGGVFSDLVDGGAGTDAFNAALGAGNSASIDIGDVGGFEALNLASGELTLTGSASNLPNWMLSSGATLNIAGDTSGGMISASGGATVNVTGSHANTVGGSAILFDGAGSVLTNSGSIASSGAPAVRLTLGGTVDNQAGGVIEGDMGVWSDGALTLDNAGAITGVNGNAVYVSAGGASITNSGALTAADADYNAVYVRGAGSLDNQAGATVTGGYDGVYFSGLADIDNAGTITAGRAGLWLDAGGTVDNLAGGTFSGAAHGVVANGGTTAVTNAGTMTGGTGYGVYLVAGSVDNQQGGLIHGGLRGVYVGGAGSVTNAGTIEGVTDNGVTLWGPGSTLTNTATGVITAGRATEGWGVFGNGSMDVDNAGQISGEVGVVFYGGGSLVNRAGGVIDGRLFGVKGETAGTLVIENAGTILGDSGVHLSVAGQVANTGTITGDTSAGLMFAGAGNLLVNAGSITSVSGVGVRGGEGVDEIQSSGLIGGGAGAIDLGGGDDVLTLLSGASLQGRVDGGEGSDLLTLAGAGAGSLDVSQLVNFEAQQMTGTGTWTLTGAATGDLAWGVAAGVLRLSGGQAVGDGATVTVGEAGTLEVAADETVGELLSLGAVTGDGTLTADAYQLFGGSVSANLGAGELYVHGSTVLNGRSGASYVEVLAGSTLTIGADERLSDTATLRVDGALDLGAFDDTVGEALISGTLAGTGTLSAELVELQGATLNANLATDLLLQTDGVSTVAGTVSADEIGVVAGTLSLAGDERLWDGSLLQIEAGAVLDLNGWDETIGELWGEGTVELDGGALSFGFGGGDSAFGGVFAGEGSLTKVGAGRFILNSDQAFAGPVNVDAGELLLNADLGGDVVVRGGTLSGWSEIGGALRVTGGVVSPGMGEGEGSLGGFFASSLTVTGGTLGFGFAGADQDFASDFIGVTGLVSLGGGTVDARPVSDLDQYGFNQGYLLIDGGSLNGQFANLSDFTQNAYAPELWQRLRYDLVEGGVVLEVRRKIDWTGDAQTGTQSLVAQALENVQMDGDDAWAEIMNVLVDLTPEQRRAAFEDMSGEGLANVTTSAAQFGDGFQGVMQGRMGPAGGGAGGMSGPTGTAFAALPFGQGARTDVLAGALNVAEVGATGAAGAWAEAFLVNSELEGRGGVVDTDTDGGGFAAGFDVDVGGGWRLGVASGYSDMKGETSDRSTTSDGTFWHLGVYAGWDQGPWYVGGAVSRLSGEVSTDREIGVGPITLDVAGATEVEALNLSGAFGRKFRLSDRLELDAGVTANGSRIRQDAYTETGAGGLSLNVGELERTLWVTELGARLTRDSQGGKLKPYVGAGAAFAAGDLDSLTSVGFVGAPAASGGFLVGGAELPPAWATLEAGLAFRPSERVWVQLGYDGALADRLKDHRGGVKVSVRW